MKHRTAFAFALAIACAIGIAPAVAAEKTVIGRLEKAWIAEADLTLRAKIDTGTQSSSLGVADMRVFRRGGKDRVRFTVTEEGGRPVTLDRPVYRFARFKEKARGLKERPVVLLHICIADIWRLIQVNLADRSAFTFPLLIGRRFLFGRALVNVGLQYTAEPHCPEMKDAGAR